MTPSPRLPYKGHHPVSARLLALIQLTRPPNILTAVADILAGFAVSGSIAEIVDAGSGWFYVPEWRNLLLLIISTCGLYGGGVVLNDFFDAELDKAERPERPIPSGKASRFGAFVLGTVLLTVGIQSASFVSFTSAMIATGIAILAVFYDGWGKHHAFFGLLNMGLCRAGNLLLGISVLPAAIHDRWFVMAIPLLYIAAVTAVSRGEVHGRTGTSLNKASRLYVAAVFMLAGLGLFPAFRLRLSLPYIVLFAWMIFMPLRKARQSRQPKDIGRAVKFGVLALIPMDAAIAAGFAGWDYALLLVLLLPLSLLLAKVFAVT